MPAPNAALIVEASAPSGATPAVFASGGSIGTTAAVLDAENAASVHDPTDIALCGLKTRIMLMNRSGRPRSAVNNPAEIGPPAAAIHRASRASVPVVPVHVATLAM